MTGSDPRIDKYISSSAEFAKPILNHLRKVVHKVCPDAKETMKWNMPYFEYRGKILCGMAAFRQHCSFVLWLGSMLSDPYKLLETGEEKTSMGHFGKLKSIDDLPSEKILVKYLKEAMMLNEMGIRKNTSKG